MRVVILILLAIFLLSSSAVLGNAAKSALIYPSGQTGLCHSEGNGCADSCIWVHPLQPKLSLIIGNDRGGGLIVWDLSGKELQFYDAGSVLASLDIRYNFKCGQRVLALIAAVNQSGKYLSFYTVDPFTRELRKLEGQVELNQDNPSGGCLYQSPLSGKLYQFVTYKSGLVQQWELTGASGSVTGKLVREFKLASAVQGCVADDPLTRFYVNEKNVALWRYGAEPGDGAIRSMVDSTNSASGGHGTADLEGLAIYYASPALGSEQDGYLISSSQGASNFQLYDRVNNQYLGSFQIGATETSDGVTATVGCEVSNLNLGEPWSSGLFIAHDQQAGSSSRSNHKLVAWGNLAEPFGLKVAISAWNPTKGTNKKPHILPISDKTIRPGQSLNFTVRASDPEGNSTDCCALNLPDGAYFDPVTRNFSWTPTLSQVGRYRITFLASDGYAIDELDVRIVVIKPQ